MERNWRFLFPYLGLGAGLAAGLGIGVTLFLNTQYPLYLNFASALAAAGYFLGRGMGTYWETR